MIPFWCACWTALHTAKNSSMRCRTVSRFWSQNSVIGIAANQFHHEIRPAGRRGAAVKDLGDVGMIHQGQGLTLRLEPGDDPPGIHARLDDLERHLPADRLHCSAMYTMPKPPSPICSRRR